MSFALKLWKAVGVIVSWVVIVMLGFAPLRIIDVFQMRASVCASTDWDAESRGEIPVYPSVLRGPWMWMMSEGSTCIVCVPVTICQRATGSRRFPDGNAEIADGGIAWMRSIPRIVFTVQR